MSPRVLLRRFRDFWRSIPARAYGSHIFDQGDGITRLSALAPTVSPEEVEKLAGKRRTDPAEFINELPIG